MNNKYFVDANGKYLGEFGPGAAAPSNSKEVPLPPQDARQKWSGTEWLTCDEVERDLFKQQRIEAVARIQVTTASGRVFDGDETSQGRMARAILGLQAQPEGATVQWVLSDNTAVDVGAAELQEALTLAGLRQTELWLQA